MLLEDAELAGGVNQQLDREVAVPGNLTLQLELRFAPQ